MVVVFAARGVRGMEKECLMEDFLVCGVEALSRCWVFKLRK